MIIPQIGAHWLIALSQRRTTVPYYYGNKNYEEYNPVVDNIVQYGVRSFSVKELIRLGELLYAKKAVQNNSRIEKRQLAKSASKQRHVAFVTRAFYIDDEHTQINHVLIQELEKELDSITQDIEPLKPSSEATSSRPPTKSSPAAVAAAAVASASARNSASAADSSRTPGSVPSTALVRAKSSSPEKPKHSVSLVARTSSSSASAAFPTTAPPSAAASSGQNNTSHRQYQHPFFGSSYIPFPPPPLPPPQPGSQQQPSGQSRRHIDFETMLNKITDPRSVGTIHHHHHHIHHYPPYNNSTSISNSAAAAPVPAPGGVSHPTTTTTTKMSKEQMLMAQLVQYGFKDKDEIMNGIRYSGKNTAHEIMCYLIEQRDMKAEARIMDEARLLSEQENQAEQLRKKQRLQEQLSNLKTVAELQDMFPQSWIIQGLLPKEKEKDDKPRKKKSSSKRTNSENNDNKKPSPNQVLIESVLLEKHRKDFLDILQLEKQSKIWYWQLPYHYFQNICTRLQQESKENNKKIDWLDTECKRLRCGLFQMDQQKNGTPKLFWDARPAELSNNVNNGSGSIIDLTD